MLGRRLPVRNGPAVVAAAFEDEQVTYLVRCPRRGRRRPGPITYQVGHDAAACGAVRPAPNPDKMVSGR